MLCRMFIVINTEEKLLILDFCIHNKQARRWKKCHYACSTIANKQASEMRMCSKATQINSDINQFLAELQQREQRKFIKIYIIKYLR